MPGARNSFLLLVVRPGAPSSDAPSVALSFAFSFFISSDSNYILIEFYLASCF